MPFSKLDLFGQKFIRRGREKIPNINNRWTRGSLWACLYASIAIYYSILFLLSVSAANIAYNLSGNFIYPKVELLLCSLLKCEEKKIDPIYQYMEKQDLIYSQIYEQNNNIINYISSNNKLLNEFNSRFNTLNANFAFNSFKFEPKFSVNPKINVSGKNKHAEKSNVNKNYDNNTVNDDSFTFYFEQGSLVLNCSLPMNEHECVRIKKYINEKISVDNDYGIVLSGMASIEKVITPTNRFSNNYELSVGRSESIKASIIRQLYEFGKSDKNIYFNCSGTSNQTATHADINDRKVDVTIYRLNKKEEQEKSLTSQ